MSPKTFDNVLERAKNQPDRISTGDKLPDVYYFSDRETKTTTWLKIGLSKAVLVFVPGADTPTCTNVHLKGFQENIEKINKLGYQVFFVSCDKVDTMIRWTATKQVEPIADVAGEFTERCGLGCAHQRLGFCAKRAAVIVENFKVKHVAVDDDAKNVCNSSAEKIMNQINIFENEDKK